MANSRNFMNVPCYALGVLLKSPYNERRRDGSISRNSETIYLSSSGNSSDASAKTEESSINSELSFPKIARFIYRCVNCQYFSFSDEKMNRHIALTHTVNKDVSTNLIPGGSVTIRIRSKDELNPEKYKLGSRYICNECPYETLEVREFFPHINIHSWLKDVMINALPPDEAWQPIHRKVHN